MLGKNLDEFRVAIETKNQADFMRIFEKYDYETGNYYMWNEIMQLKVYPNTSLLELLQFIISESNLSTTSYQGQGTAIANNFVLINQNGDYDNWTGLIQCLAEVFQGEAATPPSTPLPVVPMIQPDPPPNSAHQGFNVPFQNPFQYTIGQESQLNQFLVNYEQPPPPPLPPSPDD